jgi:hypothetical protein
MRGVLVIVPCGQAKIWDRHPQLGSVSARDAYTGPRLTMRFLAHTT